MKRLTLLLVAISTLSSARASDTLTIRQIYDFDIGDTFDYRTGYDVYLWSHNNYCQGTPGEHHDYIRYVITDKSVSANSDTITYIRKQLYPYTKVDTLIYTYLDSSLFKVFDTTSISQYVHFDSSHLTDGRLINLLTVNIPLASGYSKSYGSGLGLTDSRYGTSDGTSYSTTTSTT